MEIYMYNIKQAPVLSNHFLAFPIDACLAYGWLYWNVSYMVQR